MKQELIEQWYHFQDAIADDETIGFTNHKDYLTFKHFMFWLETGKVRSNYQR